MTAPIDRNSRDFDEVTEAEDLSRETSEVNEKSQRIGLKSVVGRCADGYF
jgi:hypothetical protein